MAEFENMSHRLDKINATLMEYGMGTLDDAEKVCKDAGMDPLPYDIVKSVQPICFEDAAWAYTAGAAIAIKKGVANACRGGRAPSASACRRSPRPAPSPTTAKSVWVTATWARCSCATRPSASPSWQATRALPRQRVPSASSRTRTRPARSRCASSSTAWARTPPRSSAASTASPMCKRSSITPRASSKSSTRHAIPTGERGDVRCYGADDVREGVAIMHHEGVDVSITGNSTNPTRFQHPVAGTYKKECVEQGKKYFSVASGGGTGRTLHPDNMAAGPASYGMTDTMGRMHSDAQFAGSSSVPAHVEMMGFIGMGNNPMVGATVAVAVATNQAING